MILGIIANINLINGIVAVICAVLQIVRKRKTALNYNIVFLYLLMAYLLLYFWSFESGLIYGFPFMIYSDVAVTFAVGPAFYLYFKRISGGGGRFFLSSYRHFIPAFAAMCGVVICLSAGDSIRGYYLVNRPAFPEYSENLFINILNTAGDFSVFVYLVLSIKAVHSIIKSKKSKSPESLRSVLYFFIAMSACTSLLFAAHYLNDNFLIAAASTAIGALVVYFFIFSYRNPGITQAIIIKEHKNRSILDGKNAADIIGRLMEMMERDRMYKNNNITLQSLSSMLGVNNHILTGIMNDKMRMNFRAFINYYRLKEAKSLLVARPDISVLDIAYEVGFNSKTSFNTAFLKETGISPMEYRERHKKTGPRDHGADKSSTDAVISGE